MIKWVDILTDSKRVSVGLEIVMDIDKLQALIDLLSDEDRRIFYRKVGGNSVEELKALFDKWERE